MTAALWQRVEPPDGFAEAWRCRLGSLSQLAGLRARVRTELTGSPVVSDPEQEHWSERLVLVVDELASNALRHGRPPVDAVLSRSGADWMIVIRDGSGERAPMPAQGRDPARGGFGLYLVADLSARHGWTADDSTKSVWAVLTAV